MAALLHLAVRTLHVFGVVALLGGAACVWYAVRTDAVQSPSLAVAYEWLFWGALGAMVATGVGNLGAVGAPGPDTRWGTVLTVKLVVVLAFVCGSFVRTVAVQRVAGQWRSERDRGSHRDGYGVLGRAYGATTMTLLALVVLAEVLAHG